MFYDILSFDNLYLVQILQGFRFVYFVDEM